MDVLASTEQGDSFIVNGGYGVVESTYLAYIVQYLPALRFERAR
jgi:hypothetical protein